MTDVAAQKPVEEILPGSPESGEKKFAGKERAPEVNDRMNEVSKAVEGAIKRPETLRIGGHRIDFLRSQDLDTQTIDRIADYFRYIFITDFPEYALCQPCDVRMGAREALGLPEDVHLSLEQADNIAGLPGCPDCGDEMEFFHDPQKTRLKIHEKLDSGAYVTLIRPEDSENIEGFNFAYEATLDEAFDKEWKYRFSYAKKQDDRFTRDRDVFLKAAAESATESMRGTPGAQEFTPDSKVLCWNCTVIGPKARNAGLLPPLLSHFFKSLPPDEVKTMCAVGETIAGTKYNKILDAAGCRSNPGVLGGDYILMTVPLQKVTDFFGAANEKRKKT